MGHGKSGSLVFAFYVDWLDINIYTIKVNTENGVVASNVVGACVNAE